MTIQNTIGIFAFFLFISLSIRMARYKKEVNDEMEITNLRKCDSICFKNINYLALLTIISSVFQCSNVISTPGFDLGPQIITAFVFIIRYILWSGFKVVLNSKLIGIKVLLLTLIVILFVSSIINGTSVNSYIRIFQLLIYIICFYCMISISRCFKKNEIYYCLRNLCIVMIVIGFVQFFITSGIIPRISIVKVLLYNDTSSSVYYHREGYRRILGTFMEPSYYAGYCVGMFYFLLSIMEERKKNIGLMCLLFIHIILTFSSTAYGAFLIVGMLYILFIDDLKLKIKLIILAIIGFLTFSLFFNDILNQVIFNKMSTESYAGRYGWNTNALNMFKMSPIIGNGYKTTRASNIIYTVLAEEGYVGMVWYILFVGNIWLALKRNKSYSYAFASVIAVVSVCITQIIAVPDFDICTLWMWMNVMALYCGNIIKIKDNKRTVRIYKWWNK